MFTKFKYTLKLIEVSVPSDQFILYQNNNKKFIKVDGVDEDRLINVTIPITKVNSFIWKNLPDSLRNDKSFKKFCKKVWKLRGLM